MTCRHKSGYIYIIRADTGHYKIGRAKSVPNRMKLFAVKLPFEFEIINYFPTDNMYTAERELHVIFDESRVNGEWFLLNDQEISFLKAIATIRDIVISDLPDWVLEDYPLTKISQHYFGKDGLMISPEYPDLPWFLDREFLELIV